MIKIRKEELEKAIEAFVKELKVTLSAFDKEEEAEMIESLYDERKETLIEDTAQYLKEVEHMEII